MGISFGSIQTGLPKDIVQQIIKAERVPIEQMEVRRGKVADKKKLVEELIQLSQDVKDKLEANKNSKSLRELKVETNEDLVKVSADKAIAEPRSYNLEVVRLAQKSSAMSSGFPNRNESYTGVGFIQYFLPNGETHEVYIDSDNASLDGIARLVNLDKSNGLNAMVVNDGSGSDSPWRLIFSLTDSGDEKKAEFPHLYFVDGERDLYLEFQKEAHDAKIKLDGFEIEVPENSAKDLIPGVTIDLKKASPGEEFPLVISEDTQSISVKIQEIIDSINKVLAFIGEQSAIDENTDTARTLGGDILLQTMSTRLQTEIFRAVPTSAGNVRLSDIGVSYQRNGTLSLDNNKMEAALEKNYKSVAELLTGYYSEENKTDVKGAIDNLLNAFNNMLAIPGGPLTSNRNALREKINNIDNRIDAREKLLARKEQGLKAKYARLEETMSRIRAQGAGLASLANQTQNIVTQLG